MINNNVICVDLTKKYYLTINLEIVMSFNFNISSIFLSSGDKKLVVWALSLIFIRKKKKEMIKNFPIRYIFFFY
jgi:hypothetical protein